MKTVVVNRADLEDIKMAIDVMLEKSKSITAIQEAAKWGAYRSKLRKKIEGAYYDNDPITIPQPKWMTPQQFASLLTNVCHELVHPQWVVTEKTANGRLVTFLKEPRKLIKKSRTKK
jgi:hypothetical protein